MINLTESRIFGIDEEEDFVGFFIVSESLEENDGSFYTKKGGARIDIYIKENVGNEPHIHLRDEQGNICRVRLRTNEYQRDGYEKDNPKLAHILEKKEEKAFRDYMHSQVPGTSMTQWERLCASWNAAWAGNNKGKGGLVNLSTTSCPTYNKIAEPKK